MNSNERLDVKTAIILKFSVTFPIGSLVLRQSEAFRSLRSKQISPVTILSLQLSLISGGKSRTCI